MRLPVGLMRLRNTVAAGKPAEVRAKVVPSVRRDTLQNEILNQIETGSKLYTDSAPAYDMLKAQDFIHEAVNHVKEYVRGETIHTWNRG